MAAEFTGFTDEDGSPVIPPGGATMKDWQEQTTLASGNLLAKSCQSAMILANHTEDVQLQAHEFGKYTAFAHKVRLHLQIYHLYLCDTVCNDVLHYVQECISVV